MRPVDRMAAFSALVEEIHNGARDPNHWHNMAVAIQRFLAVDFTNLIFIDPSRMIVDGACSGLPEDRRLDYLVHWGACDAITAEAMKAPGMQARTLAAQMGKKSIMATDVYDGFYHPNEHRHGAYIHFSSTNGRYAGIALFNREEPAPNPVQLRQLEMIASHLRGALHTADLIDLLDTRAQSADALLRHWNIALLRCSADARVIEAAGDPDRLLRRFSDALTLRGDYLHAPDPSLDARLHHLIRNPRYGEHFAGPTMTFSSSGSRSRLECTVLTLPEDAGRRADGTLPRRTEDRLVVLRKSGTQPAIDTHYLRRCLHITRAQADIVARLMLGETLADIAEHRGSTLETIRSYVKKLLQYLGCHTQGQLIAYAWQVIGFVPSSPDH